MTFKIKRRDNDISDSKYDISALKYTRYIRGLSNAQTSAISFIRPPSKVPGSGRLAPRVPGAEKRLRHGEEALAVRRPDDEVPLTGPWP